MLAFDSGAEPVVVLTKADLVDDPEPARRGARRGRLRRAGASSRAAGAATASRSCARSPPATARSRSSAPSGTGKSTLVNALLGSRRAGHDRGPRRATSAAATRPSPPQLLALPGEGWLIDTPGVRALSLWLSGQGIERAFADVFDLMDHCRFRDCKHDQEPGCAVRAAIDDGRLDPDRFASLERLVAEEAALEEEQRAKEKAGDRRRGGPPRRRPPTRGRARRRSTPSERPTDADVDAADVRPRAVTVRRASMTAATSIGP